MSPLTNFLMVVQSALLRKGVPFLCHYCLSSARGRITQAVNINDCPISTQDEGSI
jgi:hypothetical protein